MIMQQGCNDYFVYLVCGYSFIMSDTNDL